MHQVSGLFQRMAALFCFGIASHHNFFPNCYILQHSCCCCSYECRHLRNLFSLDFTPLSITGSDNYLILFGVTIVGIWNLDFFRYLYPPFCISPHYSTLSVISFEYIIAFYPLVLVFLTYISIELYDKDYSSFGSPSSGACLSSTEKIGNLYLITPSMPNQIL